MSIIKNIFNFITLGDNAQLIRYLNQIPVEKMTGDRSDLMLGMLLQKVYTSKHPNQKLMVESVLYRWANKDPKTGQEIMGESITLFESLFFNPRITNQVLKYISNIYTEYTLVGIMMDVVESKFNNDGTYNTLFGLKRIFNIYQSSYTRQEIIFIQEKAFKVGNNPIYEYLSNILKSMVVYAPKPKWVIQPKVLKKELILEKELKVKSKKYTDDEIINILKTKSESEGIKIVNISEVISDIKKLSYQRKIDTIRPLIREELIEETIGQFRLYGPSNRYPFPDEEDLTDYRDRMLKCDYFEIDPDTGESDAYDGVCWKCYLHLRHKWYAVRAPMVGGGWKGWFCNWDCVIKWLDTVYDPSFSDEKEIEKLDELVSNMRLLIDKYGIVDRLEG